MKSHCIRGHALSPATVYLRIDKTRRKRTVTRVCKECQKMWTREYQRRKAATR